jgi:hypothetical protein
MALPYVPMYEFKFGHELADSMRRKGEQQRSFTHDYSMQDARIGAEDRRHNQTYQLEQERLAMQRQHYDREYGLNRDKFNQEIKTDSRDFKFGQRKWDEGEKPLIEAQIGSARASADASRAAAAGSAANIEYQKWMREQTVNEHLRGQQEGIASQFARMLAARMNPVITRQGDNITSITGRGQVRDDAQWARNAITMLRPELTSSRSDYYRNDYNLPLVQKLVADIKVRARRSGDPELMRQAEEFDAFTNDYFNKIPLKSRNDAYTSGSTLPRQNSTPPQGNYGDPAR